MPQPVVHFQIEGRDAALLRAFYERLFGWTTDTPLSNPAQYAMIRPASVAGPPISGAISQVPESPSNSWRGATRAQGYPGHVTIYVAVPDVEATVQLAETHGGTRMLGPEQLWPGTQTALIADPEGHLVGLITDQP